MSRIEKINVTPGVVWVSIPEAMVQILCGCPADVVKHLIKIGLIKNIEKNGVTFESGPNAILLSDVSIQNGQFANLAEFPVLQMLYRQGMLLPNHPNSTGEKPLLIGNKDQLSAQMEYIYRGNYGLTSIEEMKETGCSQDEAEEIMRMKLKFAFGKIKSTDEFIDSIEISDVEVEVKNNVKIKRKKLNVFEINYKDEKTTIDLNLSVNDKYKPPYDLGFHKISREHFAVVHTGEGDGWDIHRPCMGSIVVYNGYIYLIDAGPNLLNTLNALGISVSAIRGVFHTHCHDDHFNGLTTLIQADHRIKYFSTPLVRASVSKKLGALMGFEGDILDNYFEINDLEYDRWNEVEGLLVKPTFSPHPVECANFTFRVIAEDGYKSYAHLADIASFDVINGMVTKDKKEAGISQEFFEKIRSEYLNPVDIKKIDIGGGLIHGKAIDFENDESKRIILSHTSLDLTQEEKEIGSRASFGIMDVLIPSNANQTTRYAKRYLNAFFPKLDFTYFRDILNCPVILFNPGDILIKKGQKSYHTYLTLTGSVEMIHSRKNVQQMLPAGSLIGDISTLLNEPTEETYLALGYVWVLSIPQNMYKDFADRHKLFDKIILTQKKLEFLRTLWIFNEMAYSPAINTLAQEMKKIILNEGESPNPTPDSMLYIVSEGEVELYRDTELVEVIKPGDFFNEDSVLQRQSKYTFVSKSDSILFQVPGKILLNIPAVLWKLLERLQKRKKY